MPRKSKDELNKKEIMNEVSDVKVSKTTNTSTKKTNNTITKKTKTNTSKKTTKDAETKNISANSTDITSNTTSRKVSTTAKKSSTTSKKSTTAKKSTSSSKSTKSSSNKKKEVNTKRKASSKTKTNSSIVEYYDLPFRYNETVVKILAQTPTTLFIYWDISDSDRTAYIEQYGEDFFYKTKPVLLVKNKTMNYHFEVEINDFANSWYLHVNDANCDYSVELGRRWIEYKSNIDNYVYITTSNDMEMPNNHILFDKLGRTVFFKNVKNNFIEEKEISSISFIRSIGKIYDIYDLYMEMYKNEIDIEDLTSDNIKLNLSSSNSSTFK